MNVKHCVSEFQMLLHVGIPAQLFKIFPWLITITGDDGMPMITSSCQQYFDRLLDGPMRYIPQLQVI